MKFKSTNDAQVDAKQCCCKC